MELLDRPGEQNRFAGVVRPAGDTANSTPRPAIIGAEAFSVGRTAGA
jgi:hypothetical protein